MFGVLLSRCKVNVTISVQVGGGSARMSSAGILPISSPLSLALISPVSIYQLSGYILCVFYRGQTPHCRAPPQEPLPSF